LLLNTPMLLAPTAAFDEYTEVLLAKHATLLANDAMEFARVAVLDE
jgi:hypothetical protein